jgi:sterol desaturase/sphingolipid hydroxylase (fatty acid hydroxylase superfamily)
VSHWWLNVRRAQGTRTRFNPRWPAGRRGRTLGSQTAENVLFTMVGGVPLATAWEVVTLWLVSSGRTPSVTPSDNPIWFLALFPVIALFREVHFYAVHRLLHRPPLYRAVHSLHHRNTNPGPWSGLSMHPVEHLLYFSALALHWIVPSHPLHIIFHSLHLTLAPIPGHSGFERIELGPATYRTNGYAHYLHHKLFEVNYADGTIPLDRWFGTHHDGSPEADERLRRRRTTRVGRRPQGRGRAPS